MNDQPHNETDALRSEIDTTRRRMDETMDALGNRLQGRHIVDEILGFFRGDRSPGDGPGAGEKIKRSAETALHSVVDTVKANPVPALMIGAGVAWMIYSTRRSRSQDEGESIQFESDPLRSPEIQYDPDLHTDRPLDYSLGQDSTSAGGKLAQAKDAVVEKATAASSQVKEKIGEIGGAAREKFQALRDRAGEAGSRVKERTQEMYAQSRDRVVATADQHPLQVGLACLAAGLIVGLALPTPEKVNRVAGPRMDDLRSRARQAGRDALQKGRRVAQAATHAAQEEAQAQGLSFQQVREKAGAVAESAERAAGEAAQREDLTPAAADDGARQREGGNPSGSGDPSVARPATM